MKKSHKNIFIVSLCLIICLMAVAYMSFYAQLTINAKGNLSGTWSVKIENITTNEIVGNASNKTNPTFTDNTATFYSLLELPGDSIEYAIKVTNYGTINASLKKVNLDYVKNDDIEFTSYGFSAGDIIKSGESKTLYVKVKFKESGAGATTNANLKVSLDYGQADSVEASFSTINGAITYDNAPCVNCVVTLYSGCDSVYETATDSQGNYSITNVLPGSYTLYVKNSQYSTKKIMAVNSGTYNSDMAIQKGVSTPICTE